MQYVTVDNITAKVIGIIAQTPDPRLREIGVSLVKHLHAFIREVKPTDVEFEQGCAFLVGLGQATSEKKNEVILASDILGASTLISLQNDQCQPSDLKQEKTNSALLGPFWRAHAPICAHGDNIARGAEASLPGQLLLVSGTVRDTAGKPLPDAIVDVWQASPFGLYENQDDQQPDMNLRGRFRTDEKGTYAFRSVRPSGYPVPVDGPCGDLLRAQARRPYRPAHLHFMVSKPGYKVLITQFFADDDEHLATDVTFSVVKNLVGSFHKHGEGSDSHFTVSHDLVITPGEMVFPVPPIP